MRRHYHANLWIGEIGIQALRRQKNNPSKLWRIQQSYSQRGSPYPYPLR